MQAPANSRILVITLSNIGDLVLTTPVMEALAAHYPDCAMDVLGDARSIELLRAAPYVRELYVRDKRADWRAQLHLLRTLRRHRYELIVDLRTPILPFLLRASRRLLKLHRRSEDAHAVVDHFSVLAALIPGAQPPACRLYVAPEAHATAARLLATLAGTRWLTVAPGANWPGKKWPSAYYRELLELAHPHFDGAIVLGSAADAGDASTLAGVGMPLLQAAGVTPLSVAAALIARSTAFVGNDSGLGHVAAALSVPSLTLFGPGRPARYRPWGQRAQVVLAPAEDLARLQPAVVLDALLALTAAPAHEPPP